MVRDLGDFFHVDPDSVHLNIMDNKTFFAFAAFLIKEEELCFFKQTLTESDEKESDLLESLSHFGCPHVPFDFLITLFKAQMLHICYRAGWTLWW